MHQAKADGGNPHGRNDVLRPPVLPLFIGGEPANQPVQDGADGGDSQQDIPRSASTQIIGADQGEKPRPKRHGLPFEGQPQPEHHFFHDRCDNHQLQQHPPERFAEVVGGIPSESGQFHRIDSLRHIAGDTDDAHQYRPQHQNDEPYQRCADDFPGGENLGIIRSVQDKLCHC